jgi:cobalt/nickel transport system permease protein
MGGILLGKGGVTPLFFLKLTALPLVFIVSAVLPVLVTMSTAPFEGAGVLVLDHLYWAVSPENISQCLHLFFRSLGGGICFFFFILTTPIGQIDSLLKRLRISTTFREMVILIYRFIFLLTDISSDIYRSQKARLGYSRFSLSLGSLGQLCRALFEKSGVYSNQAALALQARSCDGLIEFLQPPVTPRRSIRILIALHFIILITLYWIEEQWLI